MSDRQLALKLLEDAKFKDLEKKLAHHKDLLKSKLVSNAEKMEKLSAILKRKTIPLLAESGKLPSADEKMTTLGNIPLKNFRLPLRSSKSLPVNVSTVRNAEDFPISFDNKRMIDIRVKHLLKTKCKRDVKQIFKAKDEEKLAIEQKHAPRKYPAIKVPESQLPNRYIRGEMPCTIEHGISGHYLSWACPLDNLDYEYYLPIFFDGLQCKEHPSCFLARQGIEDMLFAAKGKPERLRPCIKLIVRPIRNALSKFDPDLILAVSKTLQLLLKSNPCIGETLLVYSKQFLAPLAAFLDMEKNTGDKIDYGQRKNDDVAEEVRNALEMLEANGGPSATRSIKFSIPTCE